MRVIFYIREFTERMRVRNSAAKSRANAFVICGNDYTGIGLVIGKREGVWREQITTCFKLVE